MTVSSVDEAFANLVQRIELNSSRVLLASQRYNAVKETVENALSGKSVRQIGSFQRKTKIRPLDLSDGLDVDALDLYIYDAALRIGAYLRLMPERVYLHAGTRIGARKSGLLPRSGDRREWLESNELPAPLRDLPSSDVENMLCIYEGRLPRLAAIHVLRIILHSSTRL